MRVIIIGCGFVGRLVGERLLQTGHVVTGTTTTADRLSEIRALGIEPALVDASNSQELHRVVRDQDAVILSVAPRSRSDDYRSTYLQTATNLVQAVRNTSVTRIIYTGSTRVYGQDDGSWVDEDSPTVPVDENGHVLVETEQALLHRKDPSHENQLSATVLRLGGIYGRNRNYLDFVRAQAGTQRDDGALYVNRIHVDDIVGAIETLLLHPYHGPLNLCDDHPQPKQTFYDAVLAAEGLPAIDWVDGPNGTGRGKRVRNDRLKSSLGITLRHPRRVL